MEQTLSIKLNAKMHVSIDSADPKDLIRAAAFWLSLPDACPVCGSPIGFEYKTPKTFKYYVLKCTGTPAHSCNLGIKQGSEELYFDGRKDWEVWRLGAGDPEPAETPANNAGSDDAAGGDPAKTRADLLNRAIKLIGQCKAAGIAPGIAAGDLGKLGDPELAKTIQDLAKKLK